MNTHKLTILFLHTPTVTFTPSKTPNVTRTPRPSVTPIPPTRTITPLPAQSFSVQPTNAPPTPVPEEPASTLVMDEDFITRDGMGGGGCRKRLGWGE